MARHPAGSLALYILHYCRVRDLKDFDDMQALIGCLIGMVLSVCASAEPLLEGRVRLASGEAVAYAQVQVFDLTDLQRGAVAQAMTDGTGSFALSLAALPGMALPERFELGANYPNPFNPSTLIPYQLAASSHVRLEVFNLLGQRIATLVEGEQPAGMHTAVWDATDAAGQAVGAGVYLYRLTVSGEHQTGRMVLVDGQAGVPAVGGGSVRPVAIAQDQEYGLVVSGQGIAPYMVPDFRIQAGMAPVDLVVDAHPAGKMLGGDCALCDLLDAFNDQQEEEDAAPEEEAETDSTSGQKGPDLIVQSPSVSATTLTAGQAFTLNATVQNQGDGLSAATTLRYYRSNNSTITSGDTEVGTDAIGTLNASATSAESIELTAPTDGTGTYFYGACVGNVHGESNTDNNCSRAVTITVGGTSGGRQASPLDAIVADKFGREVNDAGITLVDWEGYIANPAMRYTVKAPSGATVTRVTLSSSEPRLYFNLPSWNGAEGPRKELNLSGTSSQAEFYISIFPDRDGLDETHSRTIEYRDTKNRSRTQTIDIQVIDQDVPARALDFDITLDFSQDQTVLSNDSAVRETVQQAADDWAYFIDDMDLDQVSSGQEESWIWDSRGYSHGGKPIRNKMSYTGFLLYAYGVRDGNGGQPSYRSHQSSNGVRLPLRRSGNTSIDTRGNYNTLGWMTSLPDEEWWKGTNFGDVQNDLYSIIFHEIGHALVFNPGYDEFAKFKELGYIEDATVRDYYDKYPAISPGLPDHLPDTIDPASRRGAYGNEYGGEMPPGRWLITKGHLLIAQAIGYTLRETSPFIPLSITSELLPEGTLDAPYSYTANVSGGTPAYYWSIESGTLPEGLSIDSFTGTISGTPRQQGTFNFTISVSDYDETTPSITRAVTLIIREGDRV